MGACFFSVYKTKSNNTHILLFKMYFSQSQGTIFLTDIYLYYYYINFLQVFKLKMKSGTEFVKIELANT